MDPEFLAGDSYSKKLHKMLRAPGLLQAAVAFWGKGAEKIIEERRGKPAQILCNLQSGACNPYVIEKLIHMEAVSVKTSPSLHAKVVITHSGALIGSANVSANGLSIEGAQAAWDEVGLYTEIPQLRQSAASWFEQQWEDPQAQVPVSEILEAAKKKWRERSGGAPSQKTWIAEFDSEQLRGAYFTIYDEAKLSRPASSYMEKVQKDNPKIDCYEGWSDLPYNADLISLYWPASNVHRYDKVWRRCRKQDEDEIPEGGKQPVQLVAESKQLLGRPFTLDERKALFDKYLGTVEEMLMERAEQKGRRWALFGLDEVAERWVASHGKTRK